MNEMIEMVVQNCGLIRFSLKKLVMVGGGESYVTLNS